MDDVTQIALLRFPSPPHSKKHPAPPPKKNKKKCNGERIELSTEHY